MKYMKYQEFIDTVKEHIQQELNQKVIIIPVLKNNGTVYDGLVIQDPILNISPTIYLNPYFHRYLDGVSLEDIYADILKTYQDNLPSEDFDISIFRDYEKAQKRIVMKLVNAQRNKHLLRKVPHIPIYDLAIVFLCNVSEITHDYASILIHTEHMKLWNVSTEDLYEVAKENSIRLFPPRLDNLHDVYQHITGRSLSFLEDINAHILTNYLKIYGATCMVYPDLLKEIAQLFEDDLCIIPSSIHEVLLFPKNNLPKEYSTEYIESMIKEVNETELTDDEILSDHPYIYQKDTAEITY